MKFSRLGLASGVALALAACSGDSGPGSDAGDDAGVETLDIEVVQTECDYDKQCESKLGDLDGTCMKAACVQGTCEQVERAAGVDCDASDKQPGECEQGVCNGAGECVIHGARNGLPCKEELWNDCTGFQCVQGICTEIATTTCTDANPCTTDECDPATGACKFTEVDGKSCDDENACTAGDTCEAGVCSGDNACVCTKDSDCGAFEDGDLCNGTLVCEGQFCVVDEDTVVSCKADKDEDPCTENVCDPATGTCGPGNAADGTTCDDGDVCTGCPTATGDVEEPILCEPDHCVAGVCTGGESEVCDCSVDGDCTPFDDGDACTGTWTCQDGGCALDPETVPDCAGGGVPVCQAASCDPETGACGMTPLPATAACDDGDPCNGDDHCSGTGECESGALDLCACEADDDCASFDDGDLCNGVWSCQDGECAPDPGPPVDCSGVELGVCESAAVCDPETGACVPVAAGDGDPCNDDDPCTFDDVCTAGSCQGSDSGACACGGDPEVDCSQFDDDGDVCNGTWTCQQGTCAFDAGTAVDCSGVDAGACKEAVCNPTTGACDAVAIEDGTSCDDDDPCTLDDTCDGGKCEPGAPKDCSATEVGVCEKAVCGDGGVCFAAFDDGKPCTDGDPCTISDACAGGSCQGAPKDCSNLSPGTCEKAVCDDGTCVLADDDGKTCNDGDACTLVDACDGGECVGSDELECDPSEAGPCEANTCDPELGQCEVGPDLGANSETCDDGDPCTGDGSCAVGQCLGALPILPPPADCD